jgi:hypothetical protein
LVWRLHLAYSFIAMVKRVIFLAGLFMPVFIFSQIQNPPFLRWHQIKTPHFLVVFPGNITDRGVEVANLLEAAYKPVVKSLKIQVPRTPVYLFNQSIISNGFTTLMPRFIGFYTTPPQEAGMVGGTDWLQTLVVHEYRHAVQFSKLNQNFTSFVSSLFGDLAQTILMNWSVPLWVFEGDAVCTETIYSKEGRGRLPSFMQGFRAIELENYRYSYYKSYLGSFRDYVPNHYHLGYLMSAHIRKNYSNKAWSNILNRTTKISISPFAFSSSLRKYTKYPLRKTFKNCFNEFDSIWSSNQSGLVPTGYKIQNMEDKAVWTNYSYPFYISENKIVALKNGLADATSLIILENGQERTLAEINPIDRIHSNGKFVVWSSEVPDLRWGERTYSNIMVYDLDKNSFSPITKKTKYFGPAISPDGEKIAVVEYGSNMKCALVIIARVSGKVIYSYNIPDGCFIRMPSWSADGKRIVFTVSKGQEHKISVIGLSDNLMVDILPYSTESITNPVFYNDYILYGSPVSGIDAIYAIDTQTQERMSVIISKYGAYNPSVPTNGNTVVFQDYSIKGFDIGTITLDPKRWEKASGIKNRGDSYFQYLVDQEQGYSIFDTTNIKNLQDFKIKKYRPLLHAIDIHTWAVYPVAKGVGFGFLSNDKLGTTSLMAGINYFPKDAAHREFFELTYSGLYPVLEMGLSYGRRYNVENDTSSTLAYRELNEKVMRVGFGLPFNLSRNAYTTTLMVNGAYNFILQDFPQESLFGTEGEKTETNAIELGLKFSSTKQMALRDINPRVGQIFNMSYWYTPFGSGTEGERFLTNAVFYLPGFSKNHSVTFYGGYEKSSPEFREGIYKLTTDNEFVRGYKHYISDEFMNGIVSYTLPLVYPDLALGPVLYCKRVSSSMFYDYGQVKYEQKYYTFSSVGVDLNFNVNFLSFLIPFEIGLRTSYLIEENSFAFEFMFFGIAF